MILHQIASGGSPPSRRERLWFPINAVYDFGPKAINNVYGKP